MWTRLVTFLFGAFWLAMVALLCWSEFGGRRTLGLGASVETIWNKILTSPDASSMTIQLEGEDIGWCKWAPTILEAGAKSTGAEDARNLEGRIRDVVGYSLVIEGGLSIPEDPSRYQFKVQLMFDDEKQWQDFNLRFKDGVNTVFLSSNAAERQLELKTEGGFELDTRFDFDALQNPGQLAGQLGGPLAAMALANFPFLPRGTNAPSALASMKWEAEYDWTRVLNERVRCYRLRTRVLDRHEVDVIVSRVGELLRVNLPGGIVLTNNADSLIM
jgi:hypothetical protein